MGCSHSLNQSSTLAGPSSLSSLDQSRRILWYDIRNYNFDTKNFELLVLYQMNYCNSKGKMISPFLASAVVLELKRFFFLCALCIQQNKKLSNPQPLPDVSDLIPPPLVDRMWRLLISNTQAYELFSVSMFDFKLPRDSSKYTEVQKYTQTRKLMISIFGPANALIWPEYSTSSVLLLAHRGFVLLESELVPSFYEYMSRKMSKTKHVTMFAANKLEQIRKKQALRNYPNDADSGTISANTLKIIDTDEDNPTDEDSEVSAKFLGFKEMAPFPKKMMLLGDQDKIESLTLKLNSLQLEEIKEAGSNQPVPSIKSSRLDNQQELYQQAQILINSMMDNPIQYYIIKTFSNEVCVPLMVAENIFEEYKRFLILHFLGNISSRFIYPPLIKKAWDYHLAQTVEYESFCQHVFKQFLNPPILPREITASEMHDYDETLLAYQNLFGIAPPESVWISSALRFIAEEKLFIHVGCFVQENQTDSELLSFYGLKQIEKAASEMETISQNFT